MQWGSEWGRMRAAAAVILVTTVAGEIGGGKGRQGGRLGSVGSFGRDINTVIDWRSVKVPGQKESVTTAEENLRIAETDIPAQPLSPKELEESAFVVQPEEGNDPIEQVKYT